MLCQLLGSLALCSNEFFERVRMFYKMPGGNIQQVDVITSAGIVALQTMIDHLANDQASAKRLARIETTCRKL
ncbi:MAG TPA: beta-eliminating lyase-related protein [Dehalococcoidales bacterium]